MLQLLECYNSCCDSSTRANYLQTPWPSQQSTGPCDACVPAGPVVRTLLPQGRIITNLYLWPTHCIIQAISTLDACFGLSRNKNRDALR